MSHTQDKTVTIKRFNFWMYRQMACSNDSGAAAGCCASSRLRGGSLRWSDGTCGPCPGRGSSFLQMSGHASLCACAQPLWSIGCLGCVWWPCGRCPPESPRRTCRWSPRPPSRSWALSGLHSDGQHAPKKNKKHNSPWSTSSCVINKSIYLLTQGHVATSAQPWRMFICRWILQIPTIEQQQHRAGYSSNKSNVNHLKAS